MIEALVTVKQYAKIKGVHRNAVHRWIKNNKLKQFRSPNGKHWYILVDIDELDLETLQSTP